MKKKLLNNWWIKIVSLFFAFILWFVVVNIDDPVEDKTFSNIKVTLLNTNLITDKNKVYQVLDGTGVVRSVKVSALRSIVEELDEGDIVAEADFANVTVNDTIEIVFYSNRYNKEIQSITGNIEMLKLNIEDKKKDVFPIKAETNGEPADGYIIGNVNVDQNRLEISGPESAVSLVKSAIVKVDVTDATSDISTYADIKLFDADGNQLSTETLSMNAESIRVGVQVLATKEVPLEYSVMGTPAQGFMATGVIESNPTTVRIAGTNSTLAGINSIVIPEEVLNVTGQNADMMTIVNIKEYLPDNVSLVGNFNGKAAVTVYIEKQEKREIELPVDRIRVLGLGTGYEAEIDTAQTEYIVNLLGLASQVGAVNANALYGYIQMTDVLEEANIEEVKEGTYHANVVFNLGQNITLENELRVTLKISKTEE